MRWRTAIFLALMAAAVVVVTVVLTLVATHEGKAVPPAPVPTTAQRTALTRTCRVVGGQPAYIDRDGHVTGGSPSKRICEIFWSDGTVTTEK